MSKQLFLVIFVAFFMLPLPALGISVEEYAPADPQWITWEENGHLPLLFQSQYGESDSPYLPRGFRMWPADGDFAKSVLMHAFDGNVVAMVLLAHVSQPPWRERKKIPPRPEGGGYLPIDVANPDTSPDKTATLYYWLDKATAMTEPGFPEFMLAGLPHSVGLGWSHGPFYLSWSGGGPDSWIQKSAEAGFSPAMFILGWGQWGADPWGLLEKAASLGHPQALMVFAEAHKHIPPKKFDAVLKSFAATLETGGPFSGSMPRLREANRRAAEAGEEVPFPNCHRDIVSLRLEALAYALGPASAPRKNMQKEGALYHAMRYLLDDPDQTDPAKIFSHPINMTGYGDDDWSFPSVSEEDKRAIVEEARKRLPALYAARESGDEALAARRAAVLEALRGEQAPLLAQLKTERAELERKIGEARTESERKRKAKRLQQESDEKWSHEKFRIWNALSRTFTSGLLWRCLFVFFAVYAICYLVKREAKRGAPKE